MIWYITHLYNICNSTTDILTIKTFEEFKVSISGKTAYFTRIKDSFLAKLKRTKTKTTEAG